VQRSFSGYSESSKDATVPRLRSLQRQKDEEMYLTSNVNSNDTQYAPAVQRTLPSPPPSTLPPPLRSVPHPMHWARPAGRGHGDE
jgi:hypothetical protein